MVSREGTIPFLRFRKKRRVAPHERAASRRRVHSPAIYPPVAEHLAGLSNSGR
jgi:hypothetical protein